MISDQSEDEFLNDILDIESHGELLEHSVELAEKIQFVKHLM